MIVLLSVYEDVVGAFEKWNSQGKKIYIYSSGSIQAQKMLFDNSNFGNLSKVS
jgi:methionine salvage enolase-phosphatase E1